MRSNCGGCEIRSHVFCSPSLTKSCRPRLTALPAGSAFVPPFSSSHISRNDELLGQKQFCPSQIIAEGARFELAIPCGIQTFQVCALDQLCEPSNKLNYFKKTIRLSRSGHKYFSAEKFHDPDSRRRAPSLKGCMYSPFDTSPTMRTLRI